MQGDVAAAKRGQKEKEKAKAHTVCFPNPVWRPSDFQKKTVLQSEGLCGQQGSRHFSTHL